MMVACVVCVVSAGVAAGQVCDEPFAYPDGTLPPGFVSTRDPADEAEFATHDGVLEHTGSGSAHYIYYGCAYDVDVVEFDVRGSPWSFAWHISSADSLQGSCLRLFHEKMWWGWAYGVGQYTWSVPDQAACPDCAFTWHIGDAATAAFVPVDEPAEGWHHITIVDDLVRGVTLYRVYIDGHAYFTQSYQMSLTGVSLQGFGCPDVSGAGPAFDNYRVDYDVAVEQSSWGAIKALYR